MGVFNVTAGLACSEYASSVSADVVAAVSTRSLGFGFHVGFLVDAVAMKQRFPLISSAFPS
jgi:hypothetical protein